jgi:hypothetical protein
MALKKGKSHRVDEGISSCLRAAAHFAVRSPLSLVRVRSRFVYHDIEDRHLMAARQGFTNSGARRSGFVPVVAALRTLKPLR